MAPSSHKDRRPAYPEATFSPIPSSPPPQFEPFRDDDEVDPEASIASHNEKAPVEAQLLPKPSSRTRSILVRLGVVLFGSLLLLVALVSDAKPLASSLPSHVQPLVQSIYSTLRFSSLDDTAIEGGDWARNLYDALMPQCPKTPSAAEGGQNALTRMYDGPPLPRTGFASFPRSGNTFTRELVERATGYRTSSMYCDPGLKDAFPGECDRGNGSYFFRKTHYPALHGREPAATEQRQMEFDRIVQVVRNPLDTVFSWYQYHHHGGAKGDKQSKHESHIDIHELGSTDEQMDQIVHYAQRWQEFHTFWTAAPIPKLYLRYEDLRSTPLPALMTLTSFLLPAALRPSLDTVACTLTLDTTREAYVSPKSPILSSWEKWSEAGRRKVLDITKDGWCRFGYEEEAMSVLGDSIQTGIDCSSVLKASLTR